MKKKIMLSCALAMLITAGAFAQTKTSFGLRAGVNFQNLNGKDINDDKLENKLKTGFNVGVNAEIPVGIDFYVQPGVLFTTKGAKLEDSDNKINISYIEIPVNFIYKPAIGTGRLIMGFGPYAAFGMGGKVKNENGNETDIKFEKKITAAQAISGTPYLKGFDAGANLLFGYEFANKLSVQLNAGLGLVEINPEIDGVNNNGSLKNTGFGLSLGYRF